MAGLLVVHAGLLVHSAKVHSPTWDEVGHLAAGLSHWELGRFELYSVNPPLVRTLAAAPVHFFCEPQIDWSFYRSDPTLRSEVHLGRQIIELNGRDAYRYFFLARLAVIPITLLGGWLCFCWSRDLFGSVAGCIALALWTFSPSTTAYGSVITPDMASLVSLLGCTYLFWVWLKQPEWLTALLLASGLSLAILSKSVWLALPLALFAIWGLVWIGRRMGGPSERGDGPVGVRSPALLQGSHLVFASLFALVMANAFYGFHGSFQSLGGFRFVSESFAGNPVTADRPKANPVDGGTSCDGCETAGESRLSNDPATSGPPGESSGNRFRGTWLGLLRVPLPANYMKGIDIQIRDFERGRSEAGWKSYLWGQWQQGGWWYFYIVALAVKIPLGTWLLLAVAIAACFRYPLDRNSRQGVACLVLPAIGFLLVISSATGLNRYVRYALPVLPAVLIVASSVGRLFVPRQLAGQDRGRGSVVLKLTAMASILWALTGGLLAHPNQLSYFNESVGGPDEGYRVLCDSNVDWGQDLIALEQWLQANPDAKERLYLAYFGSFNPSSLGISYQAPATTGGDGRVSLRPGWYAISKNYLIGHSMPLPTNDSVLNFRFYDPSAFSVFDGLVPTAKIGQSMYVYDLTRPEVNLRRLARNSLNDSATTTTKFRHQ